MTIRREKPTSGEETARVLLVFDMLLEELARRFPPVPLVVYDASTVVPDRTIDILAVADRICARTEG